MYLGTHYRLYVPIRYMRYVSDESYYITYELKRHKYAYLICYTEDIGSIIIDVGLTINMRLIAFHTSDCYIPSDMRFYIDEDRELIILYEIFSQDRIFIGLANNIRCNHIPNCMQINHDKSVFTYGTILMRSIDVYFNYTYLFEQ